MLLSPITGMEKGQSISYNELSEENMTMRYDSAASTIFKSYIVNPDDTSNQTERLLYRRYNSPFYFCIKILISNVSRPDVIFGHYESFIR
jgi:hypothetical protein